MVLEATMLVLDNSEYMRNGDYTPTRWDAQVDAVNIVFDAKTNSHPENMVGCLTMAGKSPEVLATLTQDMGKILAALHSSKLIGSSDLATGINVASLALKHRQNKTQRQRIILFVGSPINDTSESLARIARKLKKNNVAVDVVSFGEVEGNEEALRALIENVDNGGNSHLLTIPPSPQLLSDLILSSPILMEEGAGGGSGEGGEGGASGGGGGGFEFGVDPSMDPELAMAIALSRGGDVEDNAQAQHQEGRATVAGANDGDEDVEMSEEEAIARAIEMSLKEDEENAK
ncbi:probable 26s proteasome regulatory subunit rpn10 [Ceraceosorus bombacis]|uniref:Probable 26s proteasome regulatory subunit rpn10 n=1 Tax=Ceraceosorus bombacis TaxID=401625 RepID=A0A0P1BA28_9BASI|nr:probable 26s proteasome regulatory subunit rpn10 [Ceraceosorus bombacis]